MSGVLQGNCCQTCRKIPQKTHMNGCTKKNSLTRQMLLRNACNNFLKIKQIFGQIPGGSRFVLL